MIHSGCGSFAAGCASAGGEVIWASGKPLTERPLQHRGTPLPLVVRACRSASGGVTISILSVSAMTRTVSFKMLDRQPTTFPPRLLQVWRWSLAARGEGVDIDPNDSARREHFSFAIGRTLDNLSVDEQQDLLESQSTSHRLQTVESALSEGRQYLAARSTLRDALS
jgi:hypothetical protein